MIRKSYVLVVSMLLFLVVLSTFVSAGPKEDLLALINEERNSLGKAPFSFNGNINTAAQLHSEDQLANNYFSHTSLDGRLPWDRMNDAGFFGTAYGENIAWHSGSPNSQLVFDLWKGSSGHYANMISDSYNLAGIGIATGTWDMNGFQNLFSSVYTLNLGKSVGSVCNNGNQRQCGVSDQGICTFGTQTCVNGGWSICNAVFPVTEVCGDGLDNDCDNQIDECIICNSHDTFACFNNDAYWYDSCGDREDKKEECGTNGCLAGECRVCDSHTQQFCLNNDVYWYNSCGVREDKKQECELGCDANECISLCLDVEICNGFDDTCDGIIDEDCKEGLVLISPEEDEFDSRRILFEIDVAQDSGRVLYRRNNGRWSTFCHRLQTCTKSISLPDGEHEIDFMITDFHGVVHDVSKELFIDSRAPRIGRIEPRIGFANGEFSVEFSEENPILLELNYGVLSDTRKKILDIESDCELNRRRYLCSTEVDLSDFDEQEIRYWFELTDIVGASHESRVIEVSVDTTDPILNNPESFWEQGEGRLYRYFYFSFDVTEANFDEINYIDLNDLRPRERRLCSRLIGGICVRRTAFRIGDHVLDVNIIDEAGNSITERIEFSV